MFHSSESIILKDRRFKSKKKPNDKDSHGNASHGSSLNTTNNNTNTNNNHHHSIMMGPLRTRASTWSSTFDDNNNLQRRRKISLATALQKPFSSFKRQSSVTSSSLDQHKSNGTIVEDATSIATTVSSPAAMFSSRIPNNNIQHVVDKNKNVKLPLSPLSPATTSTPGLVDGNDQEHYNRDSINNNKNNDEGLAYWQRSPDGSSTVYHTPTIARDHEVVRDNNGSGSGSCNSDNSPLDALLAELPPPPEQQQKQQQQQQQGSWSNYGGGSSRGVVKEQRKQPKQPKEEETKQENDTQHPPFNNVHGMESSPNSGVSAVTNSASYWSKKKDKNHKNGSINSKHKRKTIHLVTEEEEEDLLLNNKTQKDLLLSMMKMMVDNKVDNEVEQKDDYDNGQHALSGEELVQVVVEDILWNHVLQGHCVDENFDSTTTSSRSDNRNSSSSSRHSVANDGDGINGSIQRIRKVSDVSNLDQDHMVDTNNVTGTSSYAAHVAVVAINLISEMKMGHDSAIWNKMDGIGSIPLIESVLQQFPEEHGLFLHHGSGDTTSIPCDLFDHNGTRSSRINDSGRDHEDEWLEYLYHTQQLPEMLDLSIILEIYLRNKALNIVRRCFPIYVSDIALREFMGYKSPTARVERVLEILADFLFDVSHAMVSG